MNWSHKSVEYRNTFEQYLAISQTFSVLYCVFYPNVENEGLELALWVKDSCTSVKTGSQIPIPRVKAKQGRKTGTATQDTGATLEPTAS